MKIDLNKYIRWVGLVTLLIAGFTWMEDIMGWVPHCIYCRTVRTSIGILAILMILPRCRILTPILALPVAFMGAHVASALIFRRFRDSIFLDEFILLSVSAMFIIAVQIFMLCAAKKPDSPAKE